MKISDRTLKLQDEIMSAIRKFEKETEMRVVNVSAETDGYGKEKKIIDVRLNLEA